MTRAIAFVPPVLHGSTPQRRKGNGALSRITKRVRLLSFRVNEMISICVSALLFDGGAHET